MYFDIDHYIKTYPKAKLFYYRFGEIGLKYHYMIYSKKLNILQIKIEDALKSINEDKIIIPKKKNIYLTNLKIISKITDEKFIIIKPINGICNRLRSIISFKILSDYLNIPLYIYWSSSVGFDNSNWFDLFEPCDFLNFIDINQWQDLRNINQNIINIDEHISYINDNNRCIDDITLENIILNNSSKYNLSKICAITSIDLKYINNRIIYKYIPDYDSIYIDYFNKLQLNKSLYNIVNDYILGNNLSKNIIGIHIRQGDFNDMNNIPIYRYYNNIRTQDYFDNLIKEQINKNKYIYLCTDSKYYLSRYIKLYGNNIFYYNKQFFESVLNKEKLGQKDAIIELWIMRYLDEVYTDDLSAYGFHCKIKNDDKNKLYKLEIDLNEAYYGEHLYGWAKVMKQFKNYIYINKSNIIKNLFEEKIIFTEWLEKLLIWGNDIHIKNKLKKTELKLITFIHNPFIINYFEKKNYLSNNIILEDDIIMDNSLMLNKYNLYINKIKLLFTLTNDHKNKLLNNFDNLKNKIITIKHPLCNYNKNFNKDILYDISKIKIIHVGEWLRNINTFLDNFNNYKKLIILKNSLVNKLKKNNINLFNKIINSNCEICYFLNNNEYINIICNGILFIDLIDATANNLILECIQMNIPIICNKIPALIEYLGDKYPLFYDKNDDLIKFNNYNYLQEQAILAHDYLSKLDKSIIDINVFNKLLEYHLSKLILNNNINLLTWICSCCKADNYIENYINDFINQEYNCYLKLIIINITNSHINSTYVNNYLDNIMSQYDNITVINYDYDPGLYECWNICIKLADSKYITNANLDDRHDTNYSINMINYLESNLSCDIAICACYAGSNYLSSYEYIDKIDTMIWFDFYKKDTILYISDFKNQNPPHACPVWRRQIHETIGYFDENNYGTFADYEFWLRCLKYNLAIMSASSKPLYYYLINNDSYERSHKLESFRNNINIIYNID